MTTDNIARNVHTASVVIYSIISIVGMIGNGLVIYVTGFKMKRTVNSVWFLNLALADFLFTAFLIFTTISLAQEQQWQFGIFMCKLTTFVTVVNMFASIFLLTAISLDRCLSIWVVVWAQNKRTVCKAQLICAVIWVSAVVCSTPYATFRKVLNNAGNISYCNYPHDTPLFTLDIFRFVVGFLIPFLVIFVSYVAIAVRAGRLQRIRKRRSRRIIFSVILAFFLCWSPFHILNLIHRMSKGLDPNIAIIAFPLTVSLTFLNSCLNPILYVFLCEEFQKKLKKSICFVLESALAEDQLSFMSSRSMSSHFSRSTRKSGSITPLEKESTTIFSTSTENRVCTAEEGKTLSTV